MKHKILLWDNDGTIMGSKSPNDPTKIILPNIEVTMQKADFNFVLSGCKTPESELQNFDHEKITARFINLMEKLPINAAAFSPLIGGIACFVIIKQLNNNIIIKEAHQDKRYHKYIGQFKKPGIGMFAVIRDIAQEEFSQTINRYSSVMIGDTWHDEEAAKAISIPFINAHTIHSMQNTFG